MFQIVLALLILVGSFVLWRKVPVLKTIGLPGWTVKTFASVCSVFAVWLMVATSYVFVGSDQVGLLKKVYLGSSLQNGRIIATEGEAGFQSRFLSPGFKFRPFLNVIYDVEKRPAVIIPKGYYGLINTTDGKPLPADQVMAAAWKTNEYAKMLDATYFLTKGGGYKGLQTSVLTPGTYFVNLYQYRIQIVSSSNAWMNRYGPDGLQKWRTTKEKKVDLSNFNKTNVTTIPAGIVGVIKSNIQTLSDEECVPVKVTALEGTLTAPLVSKGCKGVEIDPLYPGAYFMNREAYDITEITTRVLTWTYKGGYIRREFQLSVTQDGSITQKETSEIIPVPDDAADAAIRIKVQGWDIPLELSVLVQVDPANAPIVVASVGDIAAVENKVMTPLIRSVVRNVIGSYKQVFALQNERALLESRIEEAIKPEGAKYGITIKEVRLREPYLPPELRVARLRTQLSEELKKTFKTEQEAQSQRIAVEKARATADQQPKLVKAEIAVQVATKFKERRLLEGQAQKAFLIEVAAGEKERANVLGAERVMIINITKEILSTLEKNPKILTDITLPQTFVTGGGLEGFGAMLNRGGGNLLVK